MGRICLACCRLIWVERILMINFRMFPCPDGIRGQHPYYFCEALHVAGVWHGADLLSWELCGRDLRCDSTERAEWSGGGCNMFAFVQFLSEANEKASAADHLWGFRHLLDSHDMAFRAENKVRQRNDIMANGMGDGVHAKYGTHLRLQIVKDFALKRWRGLQQVACLRQHKHF